MLGKVTCLSIEDRQVTIVVRERRVAQMGTAGQYTADTKAAAWRLREHCTHCTHCDDACTSTAAIPRAKTTCTCAQPFISGAQAISTTLTRRWREIAVKDWYWRSDIWLQTSSAEDFADSQVGTVQKAPVQIADDTLFCMCAGEPLAFPALFMYTRYLCSRLVSRALSALCAMEYTTIASRRFRLVLVCFHLRLSQPQAHQGFDLRNL